MNYLFKKIKKKIQKKTQKNNKVNSKNKKSITKNSIITDKHKEKRVSFRVGDYGNENLIFITFTPKIIYIHKNKELQDFNNNLESNLKVGKWETKEFNYISVYMSSDNEDMNGLEKTYQNILDFKHKYNQCHYMLVKLHDNCYLSLGYFNIGRFIFNTPDNDKIKYVNWGEKSSKSGNLNAYLVGEKYKYAINDGSLSDDHYYISNENIQKYVLNKNPHAIVYDYNFSLKNPYIVYEKKTKKRFGFFPMYKKIQINNLINVLVKKDLGF
jgi:hypothetical protein